MSLPCCPPNGAYKKYSTKTELGAPLLKKLLPNLQENTVVYLVRLKAINGLQPPASSVTGLADPFVELKLTPPDPVAQDQLQRSSTKPQTLNAKWSPPERFQFCTSNADTAKIVVSVYSFRAAREPIPLGDAVINLKDLGLKCDRPYSAETRIVQKSVKLIDPSAGKLQGVADIEVELLTVDEAVSIQEHIIYEYQRWQPVVLWGSTKPGHLLPTDPGKWSTDNGSKFGDSIAEVKFNLLKLLAHVEALFTRASNILLCYDIFYCFCFNSGGSSYTTKLDRREAVVHHGHRDRSRRMAVLERFQSCELVSFI